MVELTLSIPDDKVSDLRDLLKNFGDYKDEWSKFLVLNPEATDMQLAKAALIGVLKKDSSRYKDTVAKSAIDISIDDDLIG